MSAAITAAIELLLQVINHAGPVSAAIARARAESRPLSREELEEAFAQDDTARSSLVDAINRSGG
jgi:hypothetical protein